MAIAGCGVRGGTFAAPPPPARYPAASQSDAAPPGPIAPPVFRRADIATSGLTYGGGLVQTHPKIYVVFWGFGVTGADPDGERPYLRHFLAGIGGSPWIATEGQYYQTIAGVTTAIANPLWQLKGTWTDPSAVPSSPSDAQVQAEAAAAERYFGIAKNATYVVATPHLHDSPGFGSSYCSYHFETTSAGGPIAYVNLPYMPDAGASCGANFVNPGAAGRLDGASIIAGHEIAESQTDPFPFAGWRDASDAEIADLCDWQAADATFSTGTYPIQALYSDRAHACVFHTP